MFYGEFFKEVLGNCRERRSSLLFWIGNGACHTEISFIYTHYFFRVALLRTDFLAAFLVFGDCGKLYAAATECLIASLETNEKLDLVVYVPPTVSGELVKNFATKVSGALGIPISHGLIKTKVTGEQKIFENAFLKADNVAGAFTFENSNELIGKSILLIDDIFDSGATIKEIGKLLTNFGAIKIAPIVIAKTVGGDLR